jgi:hypothetical protein
MMNIIEPTCKARCRICGELIIGEKGDQVQVNLGSGYYAGNYDLDCFKEEYWDFIYKLYQRLTDAEREDLDRSDEIL